MSELNKARVQRVTLIQMLGRPLNDLITRRLLAFHEGMVRRGEIVPAPEPLPVVTGRSAEAETPA